MRLEKNDWKKTKTTRKKPQQQTVRLHDAFWQEQSRCTSRALNIIYHLFKYLIYLLKHGLQHQMDLLPPALEGG